jgi:hypothetical protein
MGSIGPAAVAVIGSVITLAIVAVVVSQRAQTPAVLHAGGSALAGIISAAVGPVASAGPSSFGTAANSGLGAFA